MPFNFKEKIKKFKAMKRNLPVVIANMAVRHYKNNFRLGGFVDQSLKAWQKRKTRDRSDRRNPNTRAILVKTGHLRNSIRKGNVSFSKIEIGAYGVFYGVFHNNGEGKIPKRQFIGRSRRLEKMIRARINKEMKKALE